MQAKRETVLPIAILRELVDSDICYIRHDQRMDWNTTIFSNPYNDKLLKQGRIKCAITYQIGRQIFGKKAKISGNSKQGLLCQYLVHCRTRRLRNIENVHAYLPRTIWNQNLFNFLLRHQCFFKVEMKLKFLFSDMKVQENLERNSLTVSQYLS